MLTCSLQSGSNGNCIYVEAGGVRLLFDAGISARLAEERIGRHGRALRDCTALILSHNHSDHVRGAGPIHRRFGMPIFLSEKVHRAVRTRIGELPGARHYRPGDVLEFADVRVRTLLTPHDGIDTVCFVVEHEGRRLGIFTDLGHPFPALRTALAEVHAVYLESNYDPDMLWEGSYPEDLKERIAGDGGHISNDEAALLVKRHAKGRLSWLAVAHLSEHNNMPELAIESQRRLVGKTLPVICASRYEASEVMEV